MNKSQIFFLDEISRGIIKTIRVSMINKAATGLAYFWYYQAISAIGASRAGIFINTVPVFAVVMGFLLLGEPVHFSLLTGGLMVVTGVYLTNRT